MGWNVNRPDPIWVRSSEDVSLLKDRFAANSIAAIDTETDGLDIMRCKPHFWSISFGPDRYFLESNMLEEFERVFADKNRIWVGTHTKFDAHMLANRGYVLKGKLYCTLVMDRLLDPDSDHGLKETYTREFDEKMHSFGETFYPKNKFGNPYKPKKVPQIEILMSKWRDDPELVIDYSSLDAWASFRVFKTLKKKLQAETTWRGESLWDLYRHFEAPFTKVLWCCERIGTQIDVGYLSSLKPQMEKEKEKIEWQVAKLAGTFINLASPKQIAELFYQKMKLPIIAKTKKGAPSTDVHVLQYFAENGVDIAKLMLRYRKVDKMLGTYVVGLLEKVDANGRIHGSLNQHVAETGRLSSDEPNLQNLPRSDGDEFKIRKAFIARPGYKFSSADYDQLEMMLMAHFSGDKGMIENIKMGRDIHASNASLVWGDNYDDVVAAKKKDKEELTEYDRKLLEHRQFVKVIGFGQRSGRSKTLLATVKPA